MPVQQSIICYLRASRVCHALYQLLGSSVESIVVGIDDYIKAFFGSRVLQREDAEDLVAEAQRRLIKSQSDEADQRQEESSAAKAVCRSVFVDWLRQISPGWHRASRKIKRICQQSRVLSISTSGSTSVVHANGSIRRVIDHSLLSLRGPELLMQAGSAGLRTPHVIDRDKDLEKLIALLVGREGDAVEIRELCRAVSEISECPISIRVLGDTVDDWESSLPSRDESLDYVDLLHNLDVISHFASFLLDSSLTPEAFLATLGPMSQDFVSDALGISQRQFEEKLEPLGIAVLGVWDKLPLENDATVAFILGLPDPDGKRSVNRISGLRMQVLRRDWPKKAKNLEIL